MDRGTRLAIAKRAADPQTRQSAPGRLAWRAGQRGSRLHNALIRYAARRRGDLLSGRPGP